MSSSGWSNASGGTASVLTIATAGNSVTLATSPSSGQGQVGQFALGTLIADNAARVVTFDGPVQDILNGFQLRQLGPVDAIWLGSVSSDWNSGTNWIGGNAPVNFPDTATFNNRQIRRRRFPPTSRSIPSPSIPARARRLPVECREHKVPLRNSPASSAARPMRSQWARRSTARSAILGHRS